MQTRDPRKIVILHFVTLGFYFYYWCSNARKKINSLFHKNVVPSVWFMVIPFGSFYWAWLYADALDTLTHSQIKRDDTFGLWLIAALTVPGPPYLSFLIVLSGREGDPPMSWGAGIAIMIIIYLLSVGIISFFIAAMQKRVNKFNL
jgi:hypothetical protein